MGIANHPFLDSSSGEYRCLGNYGTMVIYIFDEVLLISDVEYS